MMRWLPPLLLLLALSSTAAIQAQPTPTQLYPASTPEQALIAIERIGPEPLGRNRVRYRMVVRNLTSEIDGNDRELVAQQIQIDEPLPPALLFNAGQIRVDRGSAELKTAPLDPCPALRLDELPGFREGRNALTPNMIAVVEQWHSKIPADYRLNLLGYTDPRGKRDFNIALGRARAGEVEAQLIKLGRKGAVIRTIGMGSKDLITEEESGLALNRRVGLYPGQHQRLRWRIPELRPGESVALSLELTSGPFVADHEIRMLMGERIAGDEACYRTAVSHKGTSPTLPELRLTSAVSQSTPGAIQRDPQRLAQCNPLQLSLTLSNSGERSARQLRLGATLPKPLKASGSESARLSWGRERLERGEQFVERLQIEAPFSALGGARSETAVTLELPFEASSSPGKVVRERAQLTLLRPQIALELSGLPAQIHAGEPVELELKVENRGSWPLHQLSLNAALPSGTELANSRESSIHWELGELAVGASAIRPLTLRFMENRAMADYALQVRAHDAAYGSFDANSCVTATRGWSTRVRSLSAPRIAISRDEDVVPVGSGLRYSASVTNSNPIDQRYTLGGRLKRALWREAEGLAVELEIAGNALQGQLRFSDGEQFELIDGNGRPLSVPIQAGARIELSFPLTVAALSDDALKVSSGAIVSRFEVAELHLHAQSTHGLSRGEALDTVLLYR